MLQYRITSRHQTAIAYGGTVGAHPSIHAATPPALTVKPGVQVKTLSDAQIAELQEDREFLAHVKADLIAIEEIRPPVAAPEPAAPTGQEAPSNARIAGETEKAYLARMKATKLTPLPLPTDEEAAFLAEFFAMSPADQTAYYETITDAEKALVDTHRPKG